jgi:hypothetical protein
MTDEKQDQTIQCKGCRNPFTFTAGEQRFYEERQFTPPVRCKPCRDARKAQQNGQSAAPAPLPTAPETVEVVRRGKGGSFASESYGKPQGKPARRGGRERGYDSWEE